MSDEHSEQLRQDDADTTLREHSAESDGTVELSAADIEPLMPEDDPHRILQKAGEHPDAETTQVIDQGRLSAASEADATTDELRTTSQVDVDEETTSTFDVPADLLDQMNATQERPRPDLPPRERAESSEAVTNEAVTNEAVTNEAVTNEAKTQKFEAVGGPRTEKMQAVGTRPMPQVTDADRPAPDPEATVEAQLGQAELGEDGFYRFLAHPDADGNVKLPAEVFGGDSPGDDAMVLVCVKPLES